jgi:ABC-type multidrug transport system ATPase subunit
MGRRPLPAARTGWDALGWPRGGPTIDTVLRADGLSFSYGEVLAVDDVSLAVVRGEILGVLGPNGAGKSTVIKMLTGQLPPRTGRIEVFGLDLAQERSVIQGRIGVCFEEKNLYPALTARENLRFFARLFGRRDTDVDALLERVGLAGRGGERVSGYSKGMRQRLMIARTLVNDPDVLFLDEPTDGLDPVSARTIRGLIRDEAARGAAVLLTTHDMYEADELADRVAFLDRGRILVVDTPEDLKLRHGSRSVRVRRRGRDGPVDEVLPLDGADAPDQLRALLSRGDVLTVHSEEATLEDVFVEFAGRGLT